MEFGVNIVATVIGALVFVLLGLVLKQGTGIQAELVQLNGRFYKHVTDAGCHEAGLAHVQEQVKSAENIGKTAHQRIDRIQGTTPQ